jgi:hypothetical protein
LALTEQRKTEVGCDGLQEEGSSGGMDKMHGEDPFYSCVSCRSNAGLCKEIGREVMAQLGAVAERACTHATQSTTGAATGAVTATRGVGILSIHLRWGGELNREGAGHGHVVRIGVPMHGAYTAWG